MKSRDSAGRVGWEGEPGSIEWYDALHRKAVLTPSSTCKQKHNSQDRMAGCWQGAGAATWGQQFRLWWGTASMSV